MRDILGIQLELATAQFIRKVKEIDAKYEGDEWDFKIENEIENYHFRIDDILKELIR